MNRRVFLTAIFIMVSIVRIQAQILGGDDWVVMDTVGIVNIEILEDTENRNKRQLIRVCNRIHKIAKKLDRLARDDKSFNRISLREWGKHGEIKLFPDYNKSDTCKMESLLLALPDSLFQEAIVLKLYEYSKTIPYHVRHSQSNMLKGETLLERIGLLPATE